MHAKNPENFPKREKIAKNMQNFPFLLTIEVIKSRKLKKSSIFLEKFLHFTKPQL